MGPPDRIERKRRSSLRLTSKAGRGVFIREREQNRLVVSLGFHPSAVADLIAVGEQGRPRCIHSGERTESAGGVAWIPSKCRSGSHRSRRLSEGWLDSTLSSTEDRREIRCPWDAPGSVPGCGDRGSSAGDLDDSALRPTFENRKLRGSHRARTDPCDDT